MRIKIFFFLFILAACGKEIKLTNNLDSSLLSTDGDNQIVYQTGTLVRASPRDQIQNGSTTYYVSPYSSHLVKSFISSHPIGSRIAVKYRGKVEGNEIRMDLIE